MKKRKILIIDDEVDYCVIMKTYFQAKNLDVSISHTLQEGMALLQTIKPDILFLDNNLPDGKGWECVDEIVEIFPHLMIYLISAHRQKSDFTASSPHITVWEKPISFSTLNSIFV